MIRSSRSAAGHQGHRQPVRQGGDLAVRAARFDVRRWRGTVQCRIRRRVCGDLDAATKKLEDLAKALDRAQFLKLEITGRADPEADKEGVKRACHRTRHEGREAEGSEEGRRGQVAGRHRDSPEESKLYLTRAYKEAKFPKPRNMIGMQKDLPVEEMEKLMLTNFPASDDDLKALATRRAEAVQAWLVEQGKVPPERVFLLPPKVEAEEKAEGKAKGSRADFSLR
jgi:hypothetical protein